MRRTPILALLSTFTLVTAASAAIGFSSSRDHRGGAGQRAAEELQEPLTEAAILESFGNIVNLIWSDEEEGAWNDAVTDAEKEAFVAAFWAARDPTPGTADNEYREVWIGRAMEAHARYENEGVAGYSTSRGRFHLIYGRPAIVAEERNLAAARGGVTWTIDTSRNPFLDGKESVVFLRVQGRTFTMTTRGITLSDDAFRAGVEVSSYFAARRANPAIPGPGGASTAPGAAATMAAARAIEQLLEHGEARQDLALKQQMAYIPAQPGATYSIFNFELGKAGLTFEAEGAPAPAALRAFGVLLSRSSDPGMGDRVVYEVSIDFNVDPTTGSAEETGTHSFGMTLVPGRYRLAWGVIDLASARLATTSYGFEVPDFSAGKLQIPSVLTARGVEERADAIAVDTIYAGTRVGNLMLRTDIDNVFARDDTITVIYFIQGATIDPATQETQVEIGYRILGAQDNRLVAQLPTQVVPFFAVQQEFPLAPMAQLEPGAAYELEIHIVDLINGNELIRTVPFTIAR